MTWAETAAVAILGLVYAEAGWECAVGGVLGACIGGPVLAVTGIVAGVGIHRYRAYGTDRALDETARAAGEAMLGRLRQRLRAGQPVSAALESTLEVHGVTDVDTAVHHLAARMPAGMRPYAEGLWHAAVRRGGRIDRLVDLLLAQLRDERAMRDQLEAAFAGPRSTALLLMPAPWVAVVGLRFTVPVFFHLLTRTLPGTVTLLVVAGVQTAVLWVLWPLGGVR